MLLLNTQLTSIILPNKITQISNSAFSNSALKSVVIPKTVTFIDWCAFNGVPLTDVYYEGTQTEWNNIGLHYDEVDGNTNTALEAATKHYNYVYS